MGTFLRLIFESFRMASSQLWGNKLRSFLSLLGITIGIFCIIAVLSAIDSLEYTIKSGFSEMGSDIVFIDKFNWGEDPDDNYWKWQKRPDPSLLDYEAVKRKSNLADNVAYSIYTDAKTLKYKSNSVNGGVLMITTNEHKDVNDMVLGKGRYWTNMEYNTGQDVVILGATISKELFDQEDPVGKTIKCYGRPYRVIGILPDEGESFVSFTPNDEAVWMGINTAKKFFAINDKMDRFQTGKILAVKKKVSVTMENMKDELAGILRAVRHIKPAEENNFAVNDLSVISEVLDGVFGAFNVAAWLIGGFSLLVGMISVANIMFVSVKERTSIIGIKKSIGAKNYMVLTEFLIEAIILCLIGGMMGLILVFVMMKGVTTLLPFEMFLSMKNMVMGVSISVFVGIVAGIIPAIIASAMDPVEAMRK
ncbi:MAG: ABC transporter permease [Saprospiraceae bacterium]